MLGATELLAAGLRAGSAAMGARALRNAAQVSVAVQTADAR